MEIIKAFNSNELHTEIVIKGTPQDPLFRASDIGNILDITNIRTSIKDFSDREKVVHTMTTSGGNQHVTFLTEKGLYKVLFKSRKPIAEQFQDWVCEVIKEIRLTGEYKLNKVVEELQHQLEEKENELYQKDHAHFLHNHNKFLQLFNDNKVVYVMLLKYTTDTNKKYIIKIGKTERLHLRLKEISVTYMVKDPIILDVYESNNISKLENHIHSHNFMKELQYNYTTVNNKPAKETYIVNDTELVELKRIIMTLKDNLPNDIDKQIKLEELKLKRMEIVLENNKMIKENNEIKLKMLEKYSNKLETKEITEIQNEIQEIEEVKEIEEKPESKAIEPIHVRPRAVKGDRNPEIYQYDPVNLTFIKKHNSQIELIREKPNISLNSLRCAMKNNTIYLGYRWVLAKRNEEPIIQPTKQSVIKSYDTKKYIVRLNDDKTKILNVFASARDGIEYVKNELKVETTVHSFNRAIETGGLQFGYYWNYFDRCSIDIQQYFLSHSSLPIYVHPKGMTIYKMNDTSVEVFHSKMEVFKKCGMSIKKLNVLLDSDQIYKGFIWKTKL
jgi:prophage antirepressor-like protein